MEEDAYSRLLGRKHQAVLDLLHTVKEWDETADPKDEVLFSENIDRRQEKLDTVMRIDEEMKAIAGRKGFLLSNSDAEQTRETNEALRQVQLIMDRDIQRMKNQMEEVSKEVLSLRQRKKGIAAYEKSSLFNRQERLDIRG